jgi:hypothetical protein
MPNFETLKKENVKSGGVLKVTKKAPSVNVSLTLQELNKTPGLNQCWTGTMLEPWYTEPELPILV